MPCQKIRRFKGFLSPSTGMKQVIKNEQAWSFFECYSFRSPRLSAEAAVGMTVAVLAREGEFLFEQLMKGDYDGQKCLFVSGFQGNQRIEGISIYSRIN